jgi:hypothetical protein
MYTEFAGFFKNFLRQRFAVTLFFKLFKKNTVPHTLNVYKENLRRKKKNANTKK